MNPLKRTFVLLGACTAMSLTCPVHSTSAATKSAESGHEIFFADPTVYVENNTYYLTGTRNSSPLGFSLLKSPDLMNWEVACPSDSMILKAGDSTFGTKGFWAPQIIKEIDKYWLTYTANEQTVVAAADSLCSTFRQSSIAPVDGSEKNIDSFLFKDDDGKWYLYHVRFDNGNFLWVAEYDPETGTIRKDTLKPCFRNDQPWENTGAYPSVPIMEGPTVVKLDGKYYLFYSANHFMSIDYAVGYATADSPVGPWTKNPANPIIHRSIVGENGTGHGDLFKDLEGNFRYVFHVHNSDSEVSPRRTRIITLGFKKNRATGLYDITADPSSIIIPKTIN